MNATILKTIGLLLRFKHMSKSTKRMKEISKCIDQLYALNVAITLSEGE